MSTNWKAGMRAVCIKKDAWHGIVNPPRVPEYGVVYLVNDVSVQPKRVGLHLVGFPEQYWCNAKHFRPVVPQCDRADVGQHVTVPRTEAGFNAYLQSFFDVRDAATVPQIPFGR